VKSFGHVGGHKCFGEMYLPPPFFKTLVTTCKTNWHHSREETTIDIFTAVRTSDPRLFFTQISRMWIHETKSYYLLLVKAGVTFLLRQEDTHLG
jgi:hypothetical protein